MDTFFMTEAFDNFNAYLDNSELALEMTKSQFEQDLCAMEVAVMTENASEEDLDNFYQEASEGLGAKLKNNIKKIIDKLVSLCNRVHDAITEKFSKAKIKNLKDGVGNNSTKVNIVDGKALDSLEDETVSKLDKLKAKLKKNPNSVSEDDINQVVNDYEKKRKKIKGATIAVTATAAVTVLSVLGAKFLGKNKSRTTSATTYSLPDKGFFPSAVSEREKVIQGAGKNAFKSHINKMKNDGKMKNYGAEYARDNARAYTKWQLLTMSFSKVVSQSVNDQQSWMNQVHSKLSSLIKGATKGLGRTAGTVAGQAKVAARRRQKGTQNGYRPIL